MSVQDRAVPGVATEVIRVGPFAVHETEFAIEVTSDELAAVNEALLVDMRSAGAVVPIVLRGSEHRPRVVGGPLGDRAGRNPDRRVARSNVGRHGGAARRHSSGGARSRGSGLPQRCRFSSAKGRAVLLASAADDVGASPHGRWGSPVFVERLLADGWSAVVTSAFALIERGPDIGGVHSDWRPLFVSRLVALDDRHAFVGTNTPVAASPRSDAFPVTRKSPRS